MVDYMGLSGGFLPTADITTLAEPVLLQDSLQGGPIRFLSDANPSAAATNIARLIQQAFTNLGADFHGRTDDLGMDVPSFDISLSVQRAETEVTGRYNAATDTYGNLLGQGVIDPAKVVRTALQNAASVASLMLTTECLVAERPKGEEKAAGGGHGHGHSHDF